MDRWLADRRRLRSTLRGGQPVGVRLGLYRALPEGGFENSEWLFLPLP
jgi:hypothetical protein